MPTNLLYFACGWRAPLFGRPLGVGPLSVDKPPPPPPLPPPHTTRCWVTVGIASGPRWVSTDEHPSSQPAHSFTVHPWSPIFHGSKLTIDTSPRVVASGWELTRLTLFLHIRNWSLTSALLSLPPFSPHPHTLVRSLIHPDFLVNFTRYPRTKQTNSLLDSNPPSSFLRVFNSLL